MSEMVNPHLLEAKYKPWQAGRWERKKYLAILSGNGYTRATRREFVRASDAEFYARRALARWVRLYDAAVVAMPQPVPSPVE